MKGLIHIITGLCLLVILAGCEDEQGGGVPPAGKEEIVEVALAFDFAQEVDAGRLETPTGIGRRTDAGAFEARLAPDAASKAVGGSVPDGLYNLEIRQYDTNGAYVKESGTVFDGKKTIGEKLTIPLSVMDDCQLVVVAWGDGNSDRLSTISLAEVRKKTVTATSLTTSPAQTEINQMPYVLHVQHVKVVKDGGTTNGIIQSVPGEDTDVRLRLKRLAAKLTVKKPTYNVTINSQQYKLMQIQLQGIPTNFTVLPNPEKAGDVCYPSLLEQFKTIVLTEAEIQNDYSCWVPANARGTSAAASSDLYRTKENAPEGSPFIQYVAINQTDTKKKLNYRVYIGGKEPTDFNMLANTDYSYTANFKHTGLPLNDGRVTIVDPIPASENNNNFVETANCFMVAPGGAFNFNPYKYYQNGARINNSVLQNSSFCNVSGTTINTPIKSVKVFWQTKENGDVGDPVLGVVNSSTDHTNIVNLTDGTDLEKARIYCRVAPNTTGGSGLIAAYSGENGTGYILWSWHIWVTDYSPDPTGNEDVWEPAYKRKQKYVGNSAPDQLPMMDRNLGSMAGYVIAPVTPLEQSKANGFHYQQGRKDPFPSSYSMETKSTINNIYSSTPPKGMLNLYGPDGITYRQRERGSMSDIQTGYRNPIKMFTNSSFTESMGNYWSGTKTVHDPCPAGWQVAAKENYRALFSGDYLRTLGVGAAVTYYTPRLAVGFAWDNGKNSGGYLVQYNDNLHTTYFRMTGFGNDSQSFVIVGEAGNIWTRDVKYTFDFGFNANASGKKAYEVSTGWLSADAHNVRCIQEKQ